MNYPFIDLLKEYAEGDDKAYFAPILKHVEAIKNGAMKELDDEQFFDFLMCIITMKGGETFNKLRLMGEVFAMAAKEE